MNEREFNENFQLEKSHKEELAKLIEKQQRDIENSSCLRNTIRKYPLRSFQVASVLSTVLLIAGMALIPLGAGLKNTAIIVGGALSILIGACLSYIIGTAIKMGDEPIDIKYEEDSAKESHENVKNSIESEFNQEGNLSGNYKGEKLNHVVHDMENIENNSMMTPLQKYAVGELVNHHRNLIDGQSGKIIFGKEFDKQLQLEEKEGRRERNNIVNNRKVRALGYN